MEIAQVVSTRSTCVRRHVGAVLVKNRQILATGYNGVPRGLTHCAERGCLRDELGVPSGERHELCRGLHAEQNAIIQAAYHGAAIAGAELYCTHQPCVVCAKMLVNAGIEVVHFAGPYPDGLAQEVFAEAGTRLVAVADAAVKALSEFVADTWRAFAGLGLAMAITWALTPVVGELARRMGALDAPSARKIHSEPTPRLGGIAIYFGVIIPEPSLLVARGHDAGHPRGSFAHHVGRSAGRRAGHEAVRQVRPAVRRRGHPGAVRGPAGDHHPARAWASWCSAGWSVPFSLIWVVAIMNIVNFIDGMDGLAAGVCAISSVTFAVIAISLGRIDIGVLAAITAGATTGFLWHNFYPASIFMGDSGSMLLGFLLAAITLQGFLKGVAAVALLIPLLVLGIPIFDTGFAILRRIKNRQPIYVADRGHLHHRFANLGYSQRQTVVILYSWSGLMSVVALCMRFAPVWVTAVAAAVAVVVSALLAYELEILRWRKLTGRWPVPGPDERSGSAGERPSGPEETS